MTNEWNFSKKENYFPKIAIVNFGNFEDINAYKVNAEVRYNVKYLRIGNTSISDNLKNKNINETFLSWQNEKNEISKSKVFFTKNQNDLNAFLSDIDIVFILCKTKDINCLTYANEFSDMLLKLDILSFYFVLENIFADKKNIKLYEKMTNTLKSHHQLVVKIKEKLTIESFDNLSIKNRKKFVSNTFNYLVESLINPFIKVIENPYLFRQIKYLVFTNNNSNLVYPSIALSKKHEDRLKDALLKALINPMFQGAFNASDTLLFNIKGTFIDNSHKIKLEKILEEIFGNSKKIIVTYFNEVYDFEQFTQISIFALFSDNSKLSNLKNIINDKIFNSKVIENDLSSRLEEITKEFAI